MAGEHDQSQPNVVVTVDGKQRRRRRRNDSSNSSGSANSSGSSNFSGSSQRKRARARKDTSGAFRMTPERRARRRPARPLRTHSDLSSTHSDSDPEFTWAHRNLRYENVKVLERVHQLKKERNDPERRVSELNMPPIPVVIYVLGAPNSGKSSLIKSFLSNTVCFRPDDQDSVVAVDIIRDQRIYDKTKYELEIRRLPYPHPDESPEEYKERCWRSYEGVDVFVICYSVKMQSDLDSIGADWLPQIQAFDKPFLVVGNKADFRKNHPRHTPCLSRSDGACAKGLCDYCVNEKMARNTAVRLGAAEYLECAALAGDCGANGVNLVFERAVVAANRTQNGILCFPGPGCSVM